MSGLFLTLIVPVCTSIPPIDHHSCLFVCPGIEIGAFDTGDMSSHSAVDSGTTNANKDSERPGGPSGMRGNMTIGTDSVLWSFEQFLFYNQSFVLL